MSLTEAALTGKKILAIDAGSTTLRMGWYERDHGLRQLSNTEINNPVTDVGGSKIIYPEDWTALQTVLRGMGEHADSLVVTGAVKNPVDKDGTHQILGNFQAQNNHENIREAIKDACGHYPYIGQEHYAATKIAVLKHDPYWQGLLGEIGYAGSRTGAFTAAALGMLLSYIAEPDIPGFTLNGGTPESLQKVMSAFKVDYEFRPQRFTYNGIDVYNAGDVIENAKFYQWLISKKFIKPNSKIIEGDTYLKYMVYIDGEMHYEKEAMGASINPYQIPWFLPYMDKVKVAADDNYPYWFVSDQATKKMKEVSNSPYFLLYKNKLTLVKDVGGKYEVITPSTMPTDLETLSLIAASNFASVAMNALSHLPTDFNANPTDVHLYSGMFRKNQPAACKAFRDLLPSEVDVYLDSTPDSAGVAVINSCVDDGENIDPHEFVTAEKLEGPLFNPGSLRTYGQRWLDANARV